MVLKEKVSKPKAKRTSKPKVKVANGIEFHDPDLDFVSIAKIQNEIQRQLQVTHAYLGGRPLVKIVDAEAKRIKTVPITPIVVTLQTKGQKKNCSGHWAQGMWKQQDIETGEFIQDVNELNISAEHLLDDRYEVMMYLQHEDMHRECYDNGIKDVAAGGRHNGKFIGDDGQRAKARFLNPVPCTCGPDGKNVHGTTHLERTPEFKTFVDDVLKPDWTVFDMARKTLERGQQKPSANVSLKCRCKGTKDEPASAVMPRNAALTRLKRDGRVLPPCDHCGEEFIIQGLMMAPEPVEAEEPEVEDTNEEMSTLYLLDDEDTAPAVEDYEVVSDTEDDGVRVLQLGVKADDVS